ncbi:hypothetical protein JAAARDRAFT_41407 [Jaapia argillacea MUCL 33604]|uniref:MOSC domain-containing protein n=1 Tax=Jaapia argillacea MUCL 33604 TaxID=933084 RepID=A0A067PKZ9_9AGAM|nr:hypothetical protein JAAARDRAFT_41407 [Jaapia argillacea MUCL 33604]
MASTHSKLTSWVIPTLSVLSVLSAGVYLYYSSYSSLAKTKKEVETDEGVNKGKMRKGPEEISPLMGPEREEVIEGMKKKLEAGEVVVDKIYVHPIKSCKGTSVQSSTYTPEGLDYDRKWCVVDSETNKILTARELAKLVLIIPRIEVDPTSPYGGKLVVSFPADSGVESLEVPLCPTEEMLKAWEVIEVTMFNTYTMDGYVTTSLPPSASSSPSTLLSKYLSHPAHLLYKGPTPRPTPPTLLYPSLPETTNAYFQDGFPLHLASEESLVEVGRVVEVWSEGGKKEEGKKMGVVGWEGRPVEMQRFRPNIVLKGAGVPFAEDTWEEITIVPSNNQDDDAKHEREATSITLVSPCARCLLPNVDTITGERDKAVPYKVLMKFRTGIDKERMTKPCFGVNGVFVGKQEKEGSREIRVGDKVQVDKWLAADEP